MAEGYEQGPAFSAGDAEPNTAAGAQYSAAFSRNDLADDGGFPRLFELDGNHQQLTDYRWGGVFAALRADNDLEGHDTYIQAIMIMLSRDDTVSPAVVVAFVKAMIRLKLDPKLINAVNKSIWLSYSAKFDQVIGYQVVGAKYEHWKIYLHCSNKHGRAIVQLELFGQPPCSSFEYTLTAVNGTISASELYIIPRALFHPTPPGSGFVWTACSVSWIDIWASYVMDEQIFRPYNQLFNNCQQFIQRICDRTGLKLDTLPAIPESYAHSTRNVSGSANNFCSLV